MAPSRGLRYLGVRLQPQYPSIGLQDMRSACRTAGARVASPVAADSASSTVHRARRAAALVRGCVMAPRGGLRYLGVRHQMELSPKLYFSTWCDVVPALQPAPAHRPQQPFSKDDLLVVQQPPLREAGVPDHLARCICRPTQHHGRGRRRIYDPERTSEDRFSLTNYLSISK